MPVPKLLLAQRDFSGGEIDAAAKRRDDDPVVKTGARRMLNWRVEGTGSLVPRPGRKTVFVPPGPRNEYVRMTPAREYLVSFSAGTITIYRFDGTQVAQNISAAYLWTADTVSQISFCQAGYELVLCFPGMRPQVAVYSITGDTWSFAPFAFRVLSGQSQEPFYRFSAPGATMTASAYSGSITLTCSEPYFKAEDVGRVLSIVGAQVTITSVVGPPYPSYSAMATVSTRLHDWCGWEVPLANQGAFLPGQVAQTTDSVVKIEVGSTGDTATTAGTKSGVWGTILNSLQVYTTTNGHTADTLVSPMGQAATSNFLSVTTPQPTVQWQEQFMSAINGWPQSCFYAKGRLGFCDFPQNPEAILWSAVGINDVFWVDGSAAYTSQAAGAAADASILEFLPGKPRVRHVVEGFGDLFVFTDRGIFQVPTSVAQPLKPGGVEFRQFSNDGTGAIRPVATNDTIVYINAGKQRCSLVRATGSYTRPYASEDQSDAHSHLFTSPRQLLVATGDGYHPERYIYVLNDDGSIAVGKFGADRSTVGWTPWIGSGTVKWMTVSGALVFYTTLYNGVNLVVEAETDGLFLDGALALNNAPFAMAPPTGKGPLWYIPNSTVRVMDGLVDLGDRAVDANGVLVASSPGEDLTAQTIMAGFPFTSILQPFVGDAQPGQYEGQRQRRRRVPRITVSVQLSTGFSIGNVTVPTYESGEDATAPPVQRERTYPFATLGRSYDAEMPPLVKSMPGPLRVCEINMKATV